MIGGTPSLGLDACDLAPSTYKANFPDSDVINDYIENVDIAGLGEKYKPDMLLTSPECSSHSIARGAILLFAKVKKYRDIRFIGLSVLGAQGMRSDEDLTAAWRTHSDGIWFQNYRSVFTILDVPTIPREWINDAQIGEARTSKYAQKNELIGYRSGNISHLRASHLNLFELQSDELIYLSCNAK